MAMSDRSMKMAPGGNGGAQKPPAADSEKSGYCERFLSWLSCCPRRVSSDVDDKDKQLRAHERKRNIELRLLRAEVMDLVYLLRKIKDGQLRYSEATPYLRKTFNDISICICRIKDIEDEGEACSDAVRHILNLWEQMSISRIWAQPSGNASGNGKDDAGKDADPTENQNRTQDVESDATEMLQVIALLTEQAEALVLEVGYRTITERINDWLGYARSGHVLPFHAVFEDELLSQSARNKVLNYITWKQEEIRHGLVDASTGLIYRVPTSTCGMAWRIGAIIAVFGLLTFFFAKWDSAMDMLTIDTHYVAAEAAHDSSPARPVAEATNPESRAPSDGGASSRGTTESSGAPAADDESPPAINPAGVPLTIWIALIVGLVTHKLIGSAKRKQGGAVSVFLPVADWSYFLSSRLAQILGSLTLALFVTSALLFMADSVQDISMNYAFLAGYGLDSFAGLFGSNLERKASAEAEALRGRLGLSGNGQATKP